LRKRSVFAWCDAELGAIRRRTIVRANVRSILIVIGLALVLAAAVAWVLNARVPAMLILLLGLPLLIGGVALVLSASLYRDE
jgi:uncharacterized membrane protein